MEETAPSYPLEATIDLCARQCGGKCCRAGTMWVTQEEADRLFPGRHLHRYWLFQTANGPFTAEAGTGGFIEMNPCDHLDLGSNLCMVYHERPQACAKFPMSPQPGCLLWPLEGATSPT